MNSRSGKDGTGLKQSQLPSYRVKRDVSVSDRRRLGNPNQTALPFNHPVPSRAGQALCASSSLVLRQHPAEGFLFHVLPPCWRSQPVRAAYNGAAGCGHQRLGRGPITGEPASIPGLLASVLILERLWPLNLSWHLLPQRYRGDNAVHPLHSSLVCSAVQDKTKSKQNKAKQTPQTKSAGVKFSILFSLKQKLFSLI